MNRSFLSKSLLVIFLLYCWNATHAQSAIDKDYKGKYKEIIMTGLARFREGAGKGVSVYQYQIPEFSDFDLYPVCKTLIKKGADSINIACNTDIVKRLIISALPANGQLFEFDIAGQSIALLGSMRTAVYLEAIKNYNAGKLFFTYFLDQDSALNNHAAIYDEKKGAFLFFDKNENTFLTISKALTAKYGSIAAFEKISERQDSITAYKKAALLIHPETDADAILRESWLAWTKYLPADTGNGINHLLKDIDRQFHLKEQTLHRLSAAIDKALHSGGKLPVNLEDIYFLDVDISPVLKEVLTPEQYTSYYRKWQIDKFKLTNVSNYIFLERMPPVKQIQEGINAFHVYMQHILLDK